MATPSPSKPSTLTDAKTVQVDERVVLLDEVHFKWLLAGRGLWLDMPRFRTDPAYAAHFLALAEASGSRELRDCADSLANQTPLTVQ